MIGLPATQTERACPPANHFESIITPEAIQDILAAQVIKARAGDTASAGLVLRIAMAMSGKDTSSRRNPETPRSHPPTQALLESQLRQGAATAQQLADRTGCDAERVQLLLERSVRFSVSPRGVWSLAPVRGAIES